MNKHNWNVQVAVLPEPSVAVQVTVVQPTAKTEPEGGLHMVVTPGQLSLTVGGGNVATPLVGIGHADCRATFTTPPGGHVIVGGCVSCTVMVNVHVPLGLSGLVSTAVQVTVVVPTGKNEPEAGEQLAVGPGQLSVGVGVV